MNKSTVREVVKAIICTSGLAPDYENDFYQDASASTISAFLEGACQYFNKPRDYWMFHFCNIEYLDCPSDTIEFFVDHIDLLRQDK